MLKERKRFMYNRYLPENCAMHNVLLYKITANKIYAATWKVDVSLNGAAAHADADNFDSDLWCFGRSNRRTDVVVDAGSATFFLSKFVPHFFVVAIMLVGDVLHSPDFDIVVIFIVFVLFSRFINRSLLSTVILLLVCSIIFISFLQNLYSTRNRSINDR